MHYIIIHEATKATAKKHKYMRGNKNAPEISSIYRWMVGGEKLNKLAVVVERMGLFSYWGFAPALCSVSC